MWKTARDKKPNMEELLMYSKCEGVDALQNIGCFVTGRQVADALINKPAVNGVNED